MFESKSYAKIHLFNQFTELLKLNPKSLFSTIYMVTINTKINEISHLQTFYKDSARLVNLLTLLLISAAGNAIIS